ncbi:MAG TPA: SRPBCC family protein [Roseateles sp.]|uniref:SRPBCC family protein n=1 Tax=Roseateles sp. TaxID=1971397 RepID=UPI002ED8DD83
MTTPAAHTSFVLERSFKASAARVFAAWADPATKLRWNDCHAQTHVPEFSMDFRPGGHETYRSRLPDGTRLAVDKVFLDIAENARIVFAYAMATDGRALSASLVTVELTDTPGGSTLKLTEQLAYLDGHMDIEQRRRGTEEGLDRLMLEVDAI